MEKLKRNVILSLIVIAIALTIFAKGVFASGTVSMQTIPTGNNAITNATANTAVNLNGNVAKDNQVTPPPVVNTTTNTTKVPQTGEYDTYIIAGIAVVVVAIGAFSFVNAKRYSR